MMQGVGVMSRGDPSCSQEMLWILEKQRKWFVYLAISLQQYGVVELTMNMSTDLVIYYLCVFSQVN